jgi:hypothetical protein
VTAAAPCASRPPKPAAPPRGGRAPAAAAEGHGTAPLTSLAPRPANALGFWGTISREESAITRKNCSYDFLTNGNNGIGFVFNWHVVDL